jgi:hypothetical protein
MLYVEDSMGHHGGEGVREERDTVESWSRGAEPFLFVDCFWYFIMGLHCTIVFSIGTPEKKVY